MYTAAHVRRFAADTSAHTNSHDACRVLAARTTACCNIQESIDLPIHYGWTCIRIHTGQSTPQQHAAAHVSQGDRAPTHAAPARHRCTSAQRCSPRLISVIFYFFTLFLARCSTLALLSCLLSAYSPSYHRLTCLLVDLDLLAAFTTHTHIILSAYRQRRIVCVHHTRRRRAFCVLCVFVCKLCNRALCIGAFCRVNAHPHEPRHQFTT